MNFADFNNNSPDTIEVLMCDSGREDYGIAAGSMPISMAIIGERVLCPARRGAIAKLMGTIFLGGCPQP